MSGQQGNDIAWFITLFAMQFNLDDLPLDAETDLYAELGLDSFDAFRMLLFCETLAGVDFPPESIPEIYRVGDAYQYYRSLVAPSG